MTARQIIGVYSVDFESSGEGSPQKKGVSNYDTQQMHFQCTLDQHGTSGGF